FAALRLGNALLHRAHELVPLAVLGIVVAAREVLRGIDAVLRLAVHEEAPPEQVDLHLGDADRAQAREHHRPGVRVLLLISRDQAGVVPEVERHPVALHQRAATGTAIRYSATALPPKIR